MAERADLPESDDELIDMIGRVLTPDVPAIDDERVAQLRRAASAHRASSGSVRRLTARRLVAVAAVIAIVVGVAVAAWPDDDTVGPVEFAGPLVTGEGIVGGEVVVRRAEIGRVIALESDGLPILPTGEYYEVWFVADDDRPDALDRISAGTFHPDAEGRTDVVLTAAVDPALYPSLEVTAEQGDGDPSPGGPVVLRAAITLSD